MTFYSFPHDEQEPRRSSVAKSLDQMPSRLQEYITSVRARRDPNGASPSQRELRSPQITEVKNEKAMYEYNPDTLMEAVEKKQVTLTPHGLIDGACLFGPTDQETWRAFVKEILTQAHITSFDPNLHDVVWVAEKHAAPEAFAGQHMSTVGIYLENAPNVEEGGLGSLVETTMTLFSSLLSGQRVVIGIHPDFEKSLKDPSSLAQFEAFKMQLRGINAEANSNVTVSYKCGREEFADKVKKAVIAQRDRETAIKPLGPDDFEEFERKRLENLEDPQQIRFLGGSSAPYSSSPEVKKQFLEKQKAIKGMLGDATEVTVLNDHPYNEHWQLIYIMADPDTWDNLKPSEKQKFTMSYNFYIDEWRLLDETERRRRITIEMRKAFLHEQGIKMEAQFGVWALQSGSFSLAGLVEEGLNLRNAFKKGFMHVLLAEPLDVAGYIRTVLAEKAKLITDTTGNDKVLERLQTHPESVSLDDLSHSSLITQTSEYKKLKRIQRARAVFNAQLAGTQDLVNHVMGHSAVQLALIATDVAELVDGLSHINTPEKVADHDKLLDGYRRFTQEFSSLIAKNLGKKEKVGELLDKAIAAGREIHNPAAEKGLRDHLEESGEAATFYKTLLTQHTNAEGRTYIVPKKLELMAHVMAPNHDKLKLLGTHEQQTISDHAILLADTMRQYFKQLGFSDEEIAFLAFLEKKHENIFHELKYENYPGSKNEDERSCAVFLMVDCLGRSVQLDQEGQLTLEPTLLKERLRPLIFRHTDPELCKLQLLRPQWVFHTVETILKTVDIWQKEYGVPVSPAFRELLTNTAIESINEVMMNNDQRNRSQEKHKLLTIDQKTQLLDTRTKIQKLMPQNILK